VRVDSFDYDLPEDRIAQEPASQRDTSRLLSISRRGPLVCEQHHFADLPALLRAGDLVVVNDARVLPARLWASRESGATVEILLVREQDATPASSSADGSSARACWQAMVRPARRVRPGDRLTLESHRTSESMVEDQLLPVVVEVTADLGGGQKELTFPEGCDVARLLESVGRMPLPPYISRDRDDPRDRIDRRRYQTMFAREPGAIAAPTAGLHFTPELLARLTMAGIEHATLTLHVGPGTFQPIRTDEAEDHHMQAERYEIPGQTVAAIKRTHARGGRVVAVGTTVVRTLEHAARRAEEGSLIAGPGSADIYIFPGFEFTVVDAMLTNFHLPRSTPLLLVSAFAGRDRVLSAYRVAIDTGFRFYSYGDAMLVS
jgi:S-adenosylmethionine:tRNA ribosyltransferase-isomerase